MAVISEDMVYALQKAGDRLQQMANDCRGTVCDDYKTYGLQKEANAIREAVDIFVRQMPPSTRRVPKSEDVIRAFQEGLDGKK